MASLEAAFREEIINIDEESHLSSEEMTMLACGADDDIRKFFNFTLFGRE